MASLDLYERDFVAWTDEQARALRDAAAGINFPLDWQNLAEEIESLGGSDCRELQSRIGTVIEHLMKLDCSPAQGPRPGWAYTVRRERREIERLLEQSPSLRTRISAIIESETGAARLLATNGLDEHRELTPAVEARLCAAAYTPEQVLGDWFPEAPAGA